MRDDVLYKCVIDECTNSCHSCHSCHQLMPFIKTHAIVELKHKYATMFPVITTALLIESCYSSFYRFHRLIKNEL